MFEVFIDTVVLHERSLDLDEILVLDVLVSVRWRIVVGEPLTELGVYLFDQSHSVWR